MQPSRTVRIARRIHYAFLWTIACRCTISSQGFNTTWLVHMLLPLFPISCMVHISCHTLEQSAKWKSPFNAPQPLFSLGPYGSNELITTQWKMVLLQLLSRAVFWHSLEVNGLKISARGSISCVLAEYPISPGNVFP